MFFIQRTTFELFSKNSTNTFYFKCSIIFCLIWIIYKFSGPFNILKCTSPKWGGKLLLFELFYIYCQNLKWIGVVIKNFELKTFSGQAMSLSWSDGKEVWRWEGWRAGTYPRLGRVSSNTSGLILPPLKSKTNRQPPT